MKDPYVYPGTEILINRFNIRNSKELEEIEKEYTTNNLGEIKEGCIKGHFDIKHLKQIHQKIFGDIYPWAGEIRSVDIFKHEKALGGLSVDYSNCKNVSLDINSSLKNLNSIDWNNLSLNDKVHEFSKSIADVWKAHGFREGNTRTVVTFFSEFAKEKGFPINDGLLSKNSSYVRNSLVAASFEAPDMGIERNFSHLERIIKDAMESFIDLNKIKIAYIKEAPYMKNASDSLLTNLHELKEISQSNTYHSIKEIKSLYKELGTKIENGLLSINDPEFKCISDINCELRSLKLNNSISSNDLDKKLIKSHKAIELGD